MITRNAVPPPPPSRDGATDGDLIRQFVSLQRQSAFSELVRRHSGLLLSTALRRTGSWELAQETAQNVLTALARKAPRLTSLPSLSSWLHRAAVLESAALLRRETRYRHAMTRHQQDPALARPAVSLPPETADLWAPVRPFVDEALNSLSTSDREVLLLHHGEGRPFREIATCLGLTAAAAQRRGHRALEKLASRLRRRGVAVPMTGLAGALTAGFTSEAAGAASATSAAVLITHGQSLASAAGHSAGPSTFSPASWIAKPAFLAAAGMISASLPVLWHARAAGRPAVAEPSAPSLADSPVPSSNAENPLPNLSKNAAPDSRFLFFQQALDRLKQAPPDEGPTRLGLQLRKYLLSLTREDLRPVGKILRGSSRDHREMMALLEAFSTRLAELDPPLALELAMATSGRHTDGDFSKSIDKASLLDVLTRQSKPAFLEAARADREFGYYAINAWAAHDPLGAIEYVEQNLEGKLQESGCRKCLNVWSGNDPAAAYRWMDQRILEKPESVEQTYSFIHSETRYNTIHQLSAGEAVALAVSLRDPVLRNPLMEAAFASYSQHQPEVLAPFAPLLRLEDNARPVSVQQVVHAWRHKDAAGAAAWVESLPEGELRTTARRCLEEPLPFSYR